MTVGAGDFLTMILMALCSLYVEENKHLDQMYNNKKKKYIKICDTQKATFAHFLKKNKLHFYHFLYILTTTLPSMYVCMFIHSFS